MEVEDEIDFPRGGAPTLTPLEVRRIRTTAEKDLLFEKKKQGDEPDRKKQKKTPSKNAKAKDKDGNKDEETKEKIIDRFSFQYLVADMLIIGIVNKIKQDEIIVTLPNGVQGYLSKNLIQQALFQLDVSTDNSDFEGEDELGIMAVPDLFNVGEPIPVLVKNLYSDLKGYKKIELSVLPTDINSLLTTRLVKQNMMLWGMVNSLEDHGCSITFGNKSFSGFLPHTECDEEELPLKVGKMMWMMITRIGKKIINVTAKREKFESIMHEITHFNSFVPGQFVKFHILEIFSGGVFGKLFDSYDAIVETLHLNHQEIDPKDLLKKKVKARVIYVNPKVKQVGLSLLPSIKSFLRNVADNTLNVGQIMDDCEVVKSGKGFGLLLKINENGDMGIVNKSNISDKPVQKFGKKFSTGTKHKCRIIGFNALESKYILTMKKSILELELYSVIDVNPGQVLMSKVVKLESYGARIKISDNISALCPTMHLADINLRFPEKKFYPDKEVKCRVLTKDIAKKRVSVTCKKTLVNSELPIITSYEDVIVGGIVHGFVSSLQSYGVFISFYNGVVGLLPKAEILVAPGSSLDTMFPKGKVVQCKVIQCSPSQKRLTLTTKLTEENPVEDIKESVKIGKKVKKAKVISVDEEIRLRSNSIQEQLYLKTSHFSDFESINEEWKSVLEQLVEGNAVNLHELQVVNIDRKTNKIYVTCKQTVKDGGKMSFNDLQVGMILPGVITHIMNYGLFVEISNGLQGLALTKCLTDGYLADHSNFYATGQSVVAKVSEINEEKKRFLLSLKPSDVMTGEYSNKYSGEELLKLYLTQRQALIKSIQMSNCEQMKLLLSVDKEVLVALVTEVTKEGVTLRYEVDGIYINGFIPKVSKHSTEFVVGKECQCLAVFIDLSKKSFIGYADKDAIYGFLKDKEEIEETTFQDDVGIDCIVCYSNNDVSVALLPDHNYKVVYLPGKKHLNNPEGTKIAINHKMLARYSSTLSNDILFKPLDARSSDSTSGGITVGTVCDVVIKHVKLHQLSVTLGDGKMQGRIHISQVHDDVEEEQHVLKGFQAGEIIKAKVLGFKCLKTHKYLPVSHVNMKHSLVELSTKKSDLENIDGKYKERFARDYEVGDEVICYIEKHGTKSVKVMISPSVRASIRYLYLSPDIQSLEKPKKSFHLGGAYKATVIDYDEEDDNLYLSRIGAPKYKTDAQKIFEKKRKFK